MILLLSRFEAEQKRGRYIRLASRKFNSVDGLSGVLCASQGTFLPISRGASASPLRFNVFSNHHGDRARQIRKVWRGEEGCLLIISRPRLPPNRPDPRNLSLAPTRFIDTRPLYIRAEPPPRRILFHYSRYLFIPDLFCRHGQHEYTRKRHIAYR